MDAEQEDPPSGRFPVAGKWTRRLMILTVALLYAWMSLSDTSWYVILAFAVLWAPLALTEIYSVLSRRREYIELLPDGILLAFGWWGVWRRRIEYETITSAELRDRWFDRIARNLLRTIGKLNPPSVELRFRRRLWLWWVLPMKRLYFRPTDPETVVTALSARIGTT